MKFLFALLFTYLTISTSAQNIRSEPEHPKGNTATQMKALPHYNEACELYKNKNISGAKKSLEEAINISFDLTEAQLFLGLIYYELGILDSALFCINNGIDFSINQKEHFYFLVFETALKNGKYDILKHNASHFSKLYGKHQDTSRYESNYPYTIVDFERVQKSLDLIYDYKTWKPEMQAIDTLKINEGKSENFNLNGNGKDILVFKNGKMHSLDSKKNYRKKKKSKSFIENTEDIFITSKGNLSFFGITKNGNTDIYYSVKNGKKWSEPTIIKGEMNSDKWDSQPYFSEKDSLLYFSSDRSGNKDLYVAKINLKTNSCSKIKSLYRVNSPKDEIHPKFINGTFYFSSNGHPGLGGFDIFQTVNYRLENELLEPIDFYNMKFGCNSHKDELDFIGLKKGKFLIERIDYRNMKDWILMNQLPKEKEIEYEPQITIQKTND